MYFILMDRFLAMITVILLMSICAVAAKYAGMEGRRDLEVDVRL